MYKVLICDDEMWIRKGIIIKLKNNNFDCSWIGEAENGEVAQRLIDEYYPDIVITDIKMQKIHGLELVAYAAKHYPDIRFIIISGYSEFKFAESAIKYGVCGYLVKPITDEDFIEAMNKATKQINSRNVVNDEKQVIEQNYKYVLLEKYVNQLFMSKDKVEEKIICDKLYASVMQKHKKYLCGLISVNTYSLGNSGFTNYDLELIKYGIRNIFEEITVGCISKYCVFNHLKKLDKMIIIVAGDVDFEEESKNIINLLYDNIVKGFGIDVCLSISRISDMFSRKLYTEAEKAYQLRFSRCKKNIYYFDSLISSEKFSMPEHTLKMLEDCIVQFELLNVKSMLDDMFSENVDTSDFSDYIKLLCVHIVNILQRNFEYSNKLQFEKDDDVLSDDFLDRFNSLSELSNYMYNIIESTLNSVDSGASGDGVLCKNLMARVKNHIEKNYSQTITVSSLANKIGISANYLSTMFKQKIGKNLNHYIRDVRIQKSCELLKYSGLSIGKIAESVGFGDELYFYKVFKKAKGMTPKDYRNSNLTN